MNWRHTLALITAFAVVTACTDEREAPMDSEMVLEVAITDDGTLALTEASEEQLEEAVLSVGGLDKPLRLRVSGPGGTTIREVAAGSYDDLMTMIEQEGVVDATEHEREMEALLAAITSDELEIDVEAWSEAMGDLQSTFESFDSTRFIDAIKERGGK